MFKFSSQFLNRTKLVYFKNSRNHGYPINYIFFVLLQNCNQREDLRRFIHYGRGETVLKKLGDIIHEFTHRKSNQF